MKKLNLLLIVLLAMTTSLMGKCDWSKVSLGKSNTCDAYTFEVAGTADTCYKHDIKIYKKGASTASYTGTSRVFKFTFNDTGLFYVRVAVKNACCGGDTVFYNLIHVECKPTCQLTTEFSFKNDCKKGFFVATSNQKGATFAWNFGDHTEGKGTSPTHSYLSEGVYKVCVTATWKDSATGRVCTGTFCKEVKISCGTPCNLKGEIGFTNTGGKFRFKASSNSGYSYEWSFGDGHTGKGIDPYHEYAKPGTYTVCVTITDKTGKCKIKICKTVVVASPCNMIGSYSWKKLNDSTYKFYATSNGGTGTTYTWSWGDGTTSTGGDPSHVYKKSGVYEVCLKIYNSTKKCYTIICKKVEVTVTPVVRHCKWDKTAIKVGYGNKCNVYTFEMTWFADTCIKYQLSVYDLKTGKTYPLPAGRIGTYTFSDTGRFAIIAKYSNKCTGCDTQTYSMFNVTCKPATAKCNWSAAGANLTYSNKCNVYTFEGKNLNTSTSNCIKYTLLVGNSGATTTYHTRFASHTFKTTGTYTVCIKYYDSCKACDTMICASIKVDCLPCAAKASFTVDSVTLDGKMYVKNTSTGAKSYVWDFGDNTSPSKDKTPVHQFSASGAYTVCLTAYDSTGTCSTVYCYTIKLIRTRSNKVNRDVIKVSPNPADDRVLVCLTYSTKQPLVPYFIYNGSGQIIFSGLISSCVQINTSSWRNGIYVFRSGSVTQRIVVQH
jgi:PKD repeat protein